jgi:hypothetical protein
MVLDITKVRIACARKCWTISQAFKQANISTPTEQRIRKKLPLNPKTAGKLAAALGVDITELLAKE